MQYELFVDWRVHRDVLRCSPCVYGKERRDCVLVQSNNGVAVACLLMLLECIATGDVPVIQLALVLYFNPIYRSIGPLERATNFRRFRQRPRQSAEIVSVESIIRGALMVPMMEEAHPVDFLANDLVDDDMYLCFMYYSEKNMFK